MAWLYVDRRPALDCEYLPVVLEDGLGEAQDQGAFSVPDSWEAWWFGRRRPRLMTRSRRAWRRAKKVLQRAVAVLDAPIDVPTGWPNEELDRIMSSPVLEDGEI